MTIKNFTENNVHLVQLPLAVRVARVNAAQEHLGYTLEALERDQKTVEKIFDVLGIKTKEELFSLLPNTNPMQDHDNLYKSYLMLLARTLIRSTSPETSNSIRQRFPYTAGGAATEEDTQRLRSKFINLLELHGEVRLPSAWEKLQAFVQALFNRITGDKATANG